MFILVVAVLAVMILMALSVGYGTKIETLAARNWANTVQAQMAANTGVPLYVPAQSESRGGRISPWSVVDATGGESTVDSAIEPVAVGFSTTQTALDPAALAALTDDAASSTIVSAHWRPQQLAGLELWDPAGQVNLNALVATPGEGPDEAFLARVIDGALAAQGVVGADADALARAIVQRRHGADEPTDPRRPDADEGAFAGLDDLMSLPGVTLEVYRALEPFLAVFSASFAAWLLPDATEAAPMGWPQIDPNTVAPEHLYETLARRFPDAPRDLLGQFTANLVDRCDPDRVPTEFRADGGVWTGVEIVPYINEVCPDTASLDEDGDDGQFIEIFNPWTQTLDLSGWSLQGAGPTVRLQGTLPGQGLLVVTDDNNNVNDSTPEDEPGMGSFYNVFNVVATGGARRLIEAPLMSLPNSAGQVRLVDPTGATVDVFTWRDGRWRGTKTSLQRGDPRLRQNERQTATPLDLNRDWTTHAAEATSVFAFIEAHHDQPFASALDVMTVSAAWVDSAPWADLTEEALERMMAEAGSELDDAVAHPWRMPVLDAADDALDVRLVDCFRLGVALDAATAATTETLSVRHADEVVDTADEAAAEALRPYQPVAPTCDVILGGLNLNTAPLGVLAALPGVDGDLARRIAQARAWYAGNPDPDDAPDPDAPDWWMPRGPFDPTCWANLSDFLKDAVVWEERPLAERLEAVQPFHAWVVTHSVSLRTATRNRMADAPIESSRRPSLALSERLLSADRGLLETIWFRRTVPDADLLGDPDLLYADEVVEESDGR